jgi:hypothetical protein
MALSTFNASNNWTIDTFIEHYSLTYDELIQANRYRTLKLQASKTTAEINEMNSILSVLRNKIILEDDFNKLQEAMTGMQTYLKTNVADYLTQKQAEWASVIGQFMPKGNYNNTTSYAKWNVVLYNYESYVSKIDNNLNHTPIGDVSDIYWAKLATRGERGLPGMGLTYMSDFNNAISYSVGQAVKYNNKIYYCIAPTTGNIPTNTTYWSEFMSLSDTLIILNTTPTSHVSNRIWIKPI